MIKQNNNESISQEWRFKGNNFTEDRGIDTSDMETFAKDPLSSLAREICQNSIDARNNNEKVIIEFKTFRISKYKIPGYPRLLKEVESAMSYQKDKNKKIYNTLVDIHENITKNEITCLRISDFNTKGLEGINDDEQSPFFLLTKGSGISGKTGTTGGSKGIGKFASFVASSFNTVFYSTKNIDNEVGYIGISKLCSTRMEGTNEKTIGIGYYGNDHENRPILEQFNLDQEFKRTSFGTDVYILGFREKSDWIKEIASKILDSFMYAVQNNDLEVRINDLLIDDITLKEIINDDDVILNNYKKDIKAQYDLLNDDNIFQKEIDILGNGEGKVNIYLKEYNRDEASHATNKCVIIRYPFMKIKPIPTRISTPCSAMCIIGDNKLNEILRNIENPQHTDWETKRIHDRSEYQEVRSIINELNTKIRDYILTTLSSGNSQESDIEGASDYLPDATDGTSIGEEKTISDVPTVIKRLKAKAKEPNVVQETEEETGLIPDLGSLEDGEGSPLPEGKNAGSGGAPRDKDLEGAPKDGDSEILKLVTLTGIKYHFFVVDKKTSECVISFKSLHDKPKCLLELYYLDDNNKRYKTNIIKASINGEEAEIKNGCVVNFRLELHKDYQFKVTLDTDEIYGSEVKLYESR